jgi:DNA invertase Pin-like site-specific DNA recombinase
MTTKTTRRQATDRTNAHRRAGIYLRISEDRTGREAGLLRQEPDCQVLAERLGWDVVDTYTDNDISAYSGKRRPGYERLKADLLSGRIDAIIVWHPDRLYRRSRDLLDLIDLLAEAKPEVATVMAGTVDLSTPNGRLVAKIGADVAEHESEHKAERVARWHRARAEAGQPNGGKRPFGYQPDRVTIDETEAGFIREAAARILAGETQWSVVCDFNARGVPTVTGRPWSTISLGGVLRSPRVAGFREHNGRHYPAVWPAILDRQTWDSLRAMTAGRAKPGRPATYPLTTLLYCGGPGEAEVEVDEETVRICNARLTGSPNGSARSYHCSSQHSSHPGCGKVARNAEFLEEYVFEYVLGALDGPGFADALRARAAADEDSGEHLAALGVLEGRLKRLKHEYGVEDLWSKADFLEQKAELEERIRDLTAKVTSNGRAKTFDGLPRPDELRAWWPTAAVERKRQVIGLVVDRIIVLPAGKGGKLFDGKRFDPSRVKFIFADQP